MGFVSATDIVTIKLPTDADGGGEYGGPLLKQFLFEDNGTFHRVSAPYKSNDNGGVERLIGIVEAMTRVSLSCCTLPTHYFPYAWAYMMLLHNVLRCATVPQGLSQFIFVARSTYKFAVVPSLWYEGLCFDRA